MAWNVLAGLIEWWADEGLRDEGRRRFAGVRASTMSSDDAPHGTVHHIRAAFLAQHQPWRLSKVALSTTSRGTTPAVISWADEATAVLKGSPVERHVVGPDESWGDLGLHQVLDPTELERLVPRPWSAQFRIPGDVLERDISVLPELVSLGTDHYEISYDETLNVLTAWAAVIDGVVVQRLSLRELGVLD